MAFLIPADNVAEKPLTIFITSWTSTLSVFGILLQEVPSVDLLSPCACYSPTWKDPSISIKLYVEEHHTVTPAPRLHALEHFSLPV